MKRTDREVHRKETGRKFQFEGVCEDAIEKNFLSSGSQQRRKVVGL